MLKNFPRFSFESVKLTLLNIHIIFNSPQSISQCLQAMLRVARITLVGGVHVISLFAEGEISLEVLTAMNFFPEINEVRDKLVLVYTAGMIYLIDQVTLLHNGINHVGML